MSNKLITEKYFPVIFSLTTGFFAWYFEFKIQATKLEAILNSAISVSAILMGFLGTAKAMLLSFRSPKYTWLKSKPEIWKILLGYFKAALLSNFTLCIGSICLMATSFDALPELLYTYIIPAWATLFAYALSCFYRVLLVFFALLSAE
ncbi:hypothetical protein [Comamonas sp. JUb58]|uniref:hypothetical protein n=1 Tax=Comamonas sp. JUb58 TaxID=2485114 RepID=UPI001061010A|nr:hypothetical protein [Comamonas sp. JUb58]TDS82602.1 hypothetical protein EDF71_107238 [Comamonas sp. JUb58]